MKALDLFAGTGWGVACQWLGIDEAGVELMPEAVATRTANGMKTIYHDVWDILLDQDPIGTEAFLGWVGRGGNVGEFYDILIASPPCQTYSMAGRGDGRRALDDVLAIIRSGAWKDGHELRRAGADIPDAALVLTPLAYAYAHRPTYVVMEQVPTVLPVWQAIATELTALGYSAWTGYLQAEQYGVPQTRKRAILIARRDGKVAAPPAPTHSRYYPRDPKRLDSNVLPWISMAQALGWGVSDLAGFPRLDDGRSDPLAIGGKLYRGRDLRGAEFPAQVVTEKARSWNHFSADGDVDRVTESEAATLQSYPVEREGWGFTDRPAMTVHGHGLLSRGPTGQKAAIVEGLEQGTFLPRPPYSIETARKAGDQREDYVSLTDRYEVDAVNFTPEEAAALQSYPVEVVPGRSPEWVFERPSPTVVGSFRPEVVAAPGYRRAGDTPRQKAPGSVTILQEEAASLQSFPRPFVWDVIMPNGRPVSRGKKFLQIGNAVPPLLAEAILKEFL